MTDLNTCRVHMQTLGLNFPFTPEQEQQRFKDLVEAHHPDFCDDDVCREDNRAMLDNIIAAHEFFQDHDCNQILIKNAIEFVKRIDGIDLSGASAEEIDLAVAETEAEW